MDNDDKVADAIRNLKIGVDYQLDRIRAEVENIGCALLVLAIVLASC